MIPMRDRVTSTLRKDHAMIHLRNPAMIPHWKKGAMIPIRNRAITMSMKSMAANDYCAF